MKIKNLFLRRILAGVVDVIIISGLYKLIGLFGYKFGSIGVIYYLASLATNQTTLGGIIFGLRVVYFDQKKNEAKKPHGRFCLRAIVMFVLYLAIELAFVFGGYVSGLIILLVNLLPALLSQKTATIHDFISRSYVVDDEVGRVKKFEKYTAVFLFFACLAMIIFITLASNKKVENCVNLFQEKKYQAVVDECSEVTNIKLDGTLYFIVGNSYYHLKDYDNSLKNLLMAKTLGETRAKYIMAKNYIAQKKYDKALALTQESPNDPIMLGMVPAIYSMKYVETRDIDNLVQSYIYLSVFVQKYADYELIEDKVMQDYVKNNLPMFRQQAKKLESSKFLSEQKFKKAEREISRILNN